MLYDSICAIRASVFSENGIIGMMCGAIQFALFLNPGFFLTKNKNYEVCRLLLVLKYVHVVVVTSALCSKNLTNAKYNVEVHKANW